ncbi:MAG TPA: hypothetical protein VEY30_13550 [Myxococcaceae bacterium]|nr:hypothetical protein [Myxococcaceae bacterium]
MPTRTASPESKKNIEGSSPKLKAYGEAASPGSAPYDESHSQGHHVEELVAPSPHAPAYTDDDDSLTPPIALAINLPAPEQAAFDTLGPGDKLRALRLYDTLITTTNRNTRGNAYEQLSMLLGIDAPAIPTGSTDSFSRSEVNPDVSGLGHVTHQRHYAQRQQDLWGGISEAVHLPE